MSDVSNLPYPEAMNNLKTFDKRPRGEVLLISSKGGQAKTKAKSDAAKLRMLKRRLERQGMSDEDAAWFLARLESREMSIADTIMYLESFKDEIQPPQRIAFANALLSATKLLHGEKIKTENVNVNVNTSTEEWERRMRDEEVIVQEKEKPDEDNTV